MNRRIFRMLPLIAALAALGTEAAAQSEPAPERFGRNPRDHHYDDSGKKVPKRLKFDFKPDLDKSAFRNDVGLQNFRLGVANEDLELLSEKAR